MKITKATLKDVSLSINERSLEFLLIDWRDFLKSNNIEVLPIRLDPCLMKSSGDSFVVVDDPFNNEWSLKIPQKLAQKLAGNPYFDKKTNKTHLTKYLENLNDNDKKTIQKAKDLYHSSGERMIEVLLPVKLYCNWNGDPWNPNVSVSEIDNNDTLKYGVDWEAVKEIEKKAEMEVLKYVEEYKKVVYKISTSLKINSESVHRHIFDY
jgi:hypothetical protein